MGPFSSGLNRRTLLGGLAALPLFSSASFPIAAEAQAAPDDPLPSWNEGPAKAAIIRLVKSTTDAASPNFVPPEARIATFDQDGTLGSSIRSIRRWSIAWTAFRRW